MNIKISDLSAGYGKKNVIRNVNINFPADKISVIIGPNGCGKSTLLKCIYRVVRPTSGQVFLNDKDIADLSYLESAKKISVLTQHHICEFDFTVQDVVLMGRTPYKGIMDGNNAEDYAIAKEAMRKTGIWELNNKKFSCLSGGEQQRVMLARALTQNTECLILDEPTNHLDVMYQLQVMDIVKDSKITVIAAIHDLNIASMYCDYLYAMKEGEIVAEGNPDEIITPELIKYLYNVKATVLTRENGVPAVIYERGKL